MNDDRKRPVSLDKKAFSRGVDEVLFLKPIWRLFRSLFKGIR